MNWCAAHDFILASPVPVVDKLLARQPGKRARVEHQPAMPWRDIPDFFKNVLHVGSPTTSKTMLEILILTAVRSGEIRNMTWDEIDFNRAVWTIPASRMKAAEAHSIPLSPYLLTLLKARKEKSETEAADNKLEAPIFPIRKTRQGRFTITGRSEKHSSNLVFRSRHETPVSDMTLTKFLRDKEVASDTPGRFATAHGFRSSFRDWASENGYSRDLAERALAHTIRSAVEAAYHRTDLLEQRREMMNAWTEYCLKSTES